MPRAFCIPGVIFLFSAFALSFLVSISLPYLTRLDIARVTFGGGGASTGTALSSVQQVRFGIWGYCDYAQSDVTCRRTGHGYVVGFSNSNNNTSVIIGSSWTRGLAIHAVATAVILMALACSFSTHKRMTLLASIFSLVAALIVLIAFAVDIALFAFLKHQMGKLEGIPSNTMPGPAFWMTMVVFILLLVSTCTVWIGRRKDRGDAATSYPVTSEKGPWWRRFRGGR